MSGEVNVGIGDATPTRQTAVGALRDAAERLKRRSQRIHALADAVERSEEIQPGLACEEALWELALSIKVEF